MNDNIIKTGVMLCWSRWQDKPPADGSVFEDVAKAAFRLALDTDYTWFARTDDQHFRIGVGVLLMHYKDDVETYGRLQDTLTLLKSLSAATQGIPVDWGSLMHDDPEDRIDPLPLLPLFQEAKAA